MIVWYENLEKHCSFADVPGIGSLILHDPSLFSKHGFVELDGRGLGFAKSREDAVAQLRDYAYEILEATK